MEGSELKTWRKRKKLTQPEAAALLGVVAMTWGRWERGATPIPDHVASYCAANAPPPVAADAPRTDAELLADALKLADAYIDGMQSIPLKYGLETDYRWALSYWFDGAMVAPLIHYGTRGVTPCAAAYQAALARLRSVYNAGALYKMLARLNNCPPQIKALVT